MKGERSRDKLKAAAKDLAKAVIDHQARGGGPSADLYTKASGVLRLVIAKQGQRRTLTIEQEHELADIMDGARSRGMTQQAAAELAQRRRTYFTRLTARQLINISKAVPRARVKPSSKFLPEIVPEIESP